MDPISCSLHQEITKVHELACILHSYIATSDKSQSPALFPRLSFPRMVFSSLLLQLCTVPCTQDGGS